MRIHIVAIGMDYSLRVCDSFNYAECMDLADQSTVALVNQGDFVGCRNPDDYHLWGELESRRLETL